MSHAAKLSQQPIPPPFVKLRRPAVGLTSAETYLPFLPGPPTAERSLRKTEHSGRTPSRAGWAVAWCWEPVGLWLRSP